MPSASASASAEGEPKRIPLGMDEADDSDYKAPEPVNKKQTVQKAQKPMPSQKRAAPKAVSPSPIASTEEAEDSESPEPVKKKQKVQKVLKTSKKPVAPKVISPSPVDPSTEDEAYESPDSVKKKVKVVQKMSKKRAAPKSPSPIVSIEEEEEEEEDEPSPEPVKKKQKIEKPEKKSTKKHAPLKVKSPSPVPSTEPEEDSASPEPEPVKKKQKTAKPEKKSVKKSVPPEPKLPLLAPSVEEEEDAESPEPEPVKKRSRVEKPQKKSVKQTVPPSMHSTKDDASDSTEPVKKKQRIEKAQKKVAKKDAPPKVKDPSPSPAVMQSSDDEAPEAPQLVMKKRKVEKAQEKPLKKSVLPKAKEVSPSQVPLPSIEVDKKPAKPRKLSAKTDPVWYFKSSGASTISSPAAPSAFQITFHRALYHVVAVGNLLHELQSLPDGQWVELSTLPDGSPDPAKLKEKKIAIKKLLSTDARTKDISDLKLLRYLEIALSTWSDGDKFMPLRMHAPSMILISSLIPRYEDSSNVKETSQGSKAKVKKYALALFRLVILRIFGVGHPPLIRSIAAATTSADVTTLIIGSFPADKKSLARPIYGQINIRREVIPRIITGCEELGLELAQKIHDSEEKMTFEQIEEIVVAKKVHSINKGGILTWLFICDMAALGYCAEATWEDLARKMGIVDRVEGEDQDKSKAKGNGKVAAKKVAKPKQAVEAEDADEAEEDEEEDQAGSTVKETANPNKRKYSKVKQTAGADDTVEAQEADENEDKPATKRKGKAKAKDPEEEYSNAENTDKPAKNRRRSSAVGGGGPGKGVGLVIAMAQKLLKSNANSSFGAQPNIAESMQSRASFIRECKTVVAVLNEEFKDVFEKLGMSEGLLPRDMEHFLCKIPRMEGRGNFERAK